MTVAESNAQTQAPPIDGYAFSGLFYRCMTPVHIGCGQDVGVVDLPVIRERTTAYPVIPGSGIRGSFRDVCERANPATTVRLFGSENAEQAGCVIVCDARILLFPVRSHPGVFHWITCPFALNRYADDAEYFLGTRPAIGPLLSPGEDSYAGPSAYTPLVLEEFPFDAMPSPWSLALTVKGVDNGRAVLVSDEVFAYFVRHATIVTQHNRLSAAKTVLDGQLFSVEAVPPESLFYGFLGSTAERVEQNALDKTSVAGQLRQLLTGQAGGTQTAVILGGDEGTGLGLTRVTWS